MDREERRLIWQNRSTLGEAETSCNNEKPETCPGGVYRAQPVRIERVEAKICLPGSWIAGCGADRLAIVTSGTWAKQDQESRWMENVGRCWINRERGWEGFKYSGDEAASGRVPTCGWAKPQMGCTSIQSTYNPGIIEYADKGEHKHSAMLWVPADS